MFSREGKKKTNRVLCFSYSTAPPCGVLLTEDLLHWYLSGKHPQAEHQEAQREQVPRWRVPPPCTWTESLWPWQWAEKLIFLSLLWFRLELSVHPCYHLLFVWAVHILGSHYKTCQHVATFLFYGIRLLKTNYMIKQIKSLQSEIILVTSGVFCVTLQDDLFLLCLFGLFLSSQSKMFLVVTKFNISSTPRHKTRILWHLNKSLKSPKISWD